MMSTDEHQDVLASFVEAVTDARLYAECHPDDPHGFVAERMSAAVEMAAALLDVAHLVPVTQ